jgi:two-component system CAI-1 autoinducer sensor kinase/phosphatase CqsS
MAVLAVPMILGLGMRDLSMRGSKLIFGFFCWLQLPVFFSWMYFCNAGNTAWLASVVAMLLIYCHVTDWRLAALGTALGGLVAWLAFRAIGPVTAAMSETQVQTNTVVIAFAWAAALALGFSAANLRREQLRHTLATVGIMAHELRTPLATISLVGDVMRSEGERAGDEARVRLDKLALRVQTMVRNMNHQIDGQIANARLLRLPLHRESVSAAHLVREAVSSYPFRTTRERECVTVLVRRDFRFMGSQALFSQVLDNLIKNALKALAATSRPARPGDLTIEVGVLNNRGRILVTDQGVGISPQLAPRVFEPFFSTDKGTGHGLGLAFCRRVVNSVGGHLHVTSARGKGATFTIELPLLR